MAFIRLSDSWKDPLQVVFDFSQFSEEDVASIQKIQLGWSLSITGLFKDSPAKGQRFEMVATSFKIFGKVDDQGSYPLAKTTLTLEHFRQYPHLECRAKEKATIYGIRAVLKRAIDEFLMKKHYIETQMPSITHSECEGGCSVFGVTRVLDDKKLSKIPRVVGPDGKETDEIDFSKDFFGSTAFLTVSAQLELETHLPLGAVYTWTKAFRGEKSMTTRHLAEFLMLEIEKLCESAKDIMDDTEELIKYAIEFLLTHHRSDLEYLQSKFETGLIAKLEKTVAKPFVRVTHAQCVDILKQQPKGKFQEEPDYEGDMASEHERFLVDEHFKHTVIVMRYPKKIKSFYMPVIQETPEESHGVEHVDSFDILIEGLGELVGGSSRIYDLDALETRIRDLGMDPKPIDFYIETRRKSVPPHGGAGLGFERFVKFVTGAQSVRDCVAYPKYVGSSKA